MDRKIAISNVPIITAVLYKGHLPIAVGHLDVGAGKTWLGVSTVHGFTGLGRKNEKAL